MVAVLAHIGQDHAGAVGDHGVAREGGGVEAVDRGQRLQELLGVGVGRDRRHQEQAQQDAEQADCRLAALALADGRPGGVDSGTRRVPAPSPVDARAFLSHGEGLAPGIVMGDATDPKPVGAGLAPTLRR